MLAADFAPRLRLDTIGCRSERPTSDAAAVAGGVQRSTCHPVAWALSSEEDAAGDSAVAAHPFERDSVPRGDVLEGCRLHLLSKWRRYAVRQTDAAPLGRVKVEDARRRGVGNVISDTAMVPSCPPFYGCEPQLCPRGRSKCLAEHALAAREAGQRLRNCSDGRAAADEFKRERR